MVGRYVLSPAIFDALGESGSDAGRELNLSDAIERLLPHEPVFAYSFEGRRFDCSSKLGFLEATVSLALEHPEVGPGFARLLRRLDGVPAAPARRAGTREGPRAAPPVPH
jgi:UTP--glucose-1-phosphate uridylyltransferase